MQSAVEESEESKVLHLAGPLDGMDVEEVVICGFSFATISTHPPVDNPTPVPLSTTVCRLWPTIAA